MKFRTDIIDELMKKNIVIFGAGHIADEFCREFIDILSISFFVSNNTLEKKVDINNRTFDVFRPEEKLIHNIDELVVICIENFEPIEEQLFYMGYRYGEDYVDYRFFKWMTSGKKLAFSYGVCYMRSISECLEKSDTFSKDHEVFCRLSYKDIKNYEYDALAFMLQFCELYLYNSVLTKTERTKNEFFLSILPKSCITISIPIINFVGYHPQAVSDNFYDNRYCIVSKGTDWAPFLSADRNINAFIDEKMSCSEIVKKIGSRNFYEAGFLEKNYERELRRIAILEADSDIIISDFIKANRGKKRLFYNETHVSNEVIIELAKRVLRRIEYSDYLPELELLERELLHTSEVPLYPSVICGLGLDVYLADNMTYRLFTFKGPKYVTFEEYVEQYYEFCSDMKKYKLVGMFP
ncbi:MAG: hypothetical protein II842_14390 [Butyrivibrio sp.]|nr:hypothetical protein [Butyrivibrio sp.]